MRGCENEKEHALWQEMRTPAISVPTTTVIVLSCLTDRILLSIFDSKYSLVSG